MDHAVSSAYASSSINPLPTDIHNGMIAMGLVGVLSTASTGSLLLFITYRMVYWRRFYDLPLATNQIFILIFNLLLADFQQALSFLIAFYWLAQDQLVGPSKICFAQGWLIQIGDLSSGIWVLSIAVHTFVGLVLQKTIPFPAFVGGILTVWLFCLVLTAVGPIMHGTKFFVPAGVWCWIGEDHGTHRLTLHYLWIFISQLGSIVIYLTIYLYLRFRVASSIQPQGMLSDGSANTSSPSYNNYTKRMVGITTTTIVSNPARNPFVVSRQKILRTARYMVVYPFAYVTLTLPLAVGRVSAMANKNPPMIFYCVAGTMMASCGFIDVGLYMYTRNALVRSSIGLKESNGAFGDNNPSTYPNGNPGIGDLEGESSDNIRMDGLREGRDTDSLSIEHKEALGRSAIIVSRSVTRTEDQFPQNAKYHRSDSLRSLVERKEEGSGSDKSWLTAT
ncbi:Family A G protein-coupled receptor-like protein [Venustampulla echinocandica]|uniref:Family A G protein-coupled receptor-like protein n=1 Tax=Venustampulla echinocandica TaxID=2656787 RepID=A0A370TAN8_9HELO|nr:Family A G protein-coupled receptor-like protein [Venustampulla echinocandica]RDL31003.1 Family A G protein-coupled receptor-like protein [Venustampulla echinocandica]